MAGTKVILSVLVGILCIILLANCDNDKANRLTKQSHFNNLNDPDYLVTLLDNPDDLEAESIGLDGHESESYKIFKKLSAVSSDTTLLRLTKHNNPKIRVYSMWALTEKNRCLALEQMKYFKNDKANVVYTSGCVSMPEKVSWLTASKFDTTEVVMLPKKASPDYDIIIK